MKKLIRDIEACRICAERFAATATAHEPRPVIRMAKDARILIAGQAPGLRVHETGIPFNDPSGDRLRDWMSVDRETFYDPKCCAIIPMAFCFPGYDAKGSDLPPPKICAQTWRSRVIKALGEVRLTLVIGGYAQRWHMGGREGVTARVQNWRAHRRRFSPCRTHHGAIPHG